MRAQSCLLAGHGQNGASGRLHEQMEPDVQNDLVKSDGSRTAFLSDIHGNSPALLSVLHDIRREQCSRVFVLGDTINGVDPQGSVNILRSFGRESGVELACIKGNAEAYLTAPYRDYFAEDTDTWHLDILRRLQWFQAQLSGSDLDWINSLPDTIRWKDALLVHDSPRDRVAVKAQANIPPQYRELAYHGRGILPDMTEADLQTLLDFMSKEHVAAVFSGHTHQPFFRQFGELLVCNVGSVGMPLDGDPRASWAMLTGFGSSKMSVSIRRVGYDISSTLEMIDCTRDLFQTASSKDAYKSMFVTGRYRREP